MLTITTAVTVVTDSPGCCLLLRDICSGVASGGMDAIAEVRDSAVFRHAGEDTVFHLPEEQPAPKP
jgi:hypothetical protein